MTKQKQEFTLESAVFGELSNPIRLQILLNLKQKPILASHLAKKMNTTIQGIQRHVNRLKSTDLIEKNPDGVISLSRLGEISLVQLPAFQFLTSNLEFFSTHNFGDIPPDLEARIGEIQSSKKPMDITWTIGNVRKIIKNSKKFLKCIFTQPPIMTGDLMQTQLKNDVKIFLLFGKNSIISSQSKMIELLELKTRTFHKNMEKRMTENVGINLVMNEKKAILFFSNIDGKTDVYNSFLGTDFAFQNWCSDFFDFKWNQGLPFSRLR